MLAVFIFSHEDFLAVTVRRSRADGLRQVEYSFQGHPTLFGSDYSSYLLPHTLCLNANWTLKPGYNHFCPPEMNA